MPLHRTERCSDFPSDVGLQLVHGQNFRHISVVSEAHAVTPLGGGGGGLHATHYHHMHTSRGCVCLGHGGMEVCMG